MASPEKINEWKEKYGSIYKTTIGGNEYIFRTMDRTTYLEILAKQTILENFDNDLEVFKACVLNSYQEADLTTKAGIVSVISEKIMIASGFELTETEEL